MLCIRLDPVSKLKFSQNYTNIREIRVGGLHFSLHIAFIPSLFLCVLSLYAHGEIEMMHVRYVIYIPRLEAYIFMAAA